MSKKANLKTCSFRHPSVSSYNIYPLLFAPKNKFFRALDFPRIFGQHPKNSAYHQNQQSERAWLSDLKAWRSTIPDRSSKGGVLWLSKGNFCMIRCHFIICFRHYTFKMQDLRYQVLKNARFIVLNLTKMTLFRHCRLLGLNDKKWVI